MALLIDTSVFIRMERDDRPVGELAIEWPEERFAVAAITASELLYGVERADTEARRIRRRAYVDTILRTLPVIAFDLAVAEVHAKLGASLAKIGRPIGPNDLLISAATLTMGYSVATENVREFDTIPGLVVVRPGS
jgi:predicted nucleic acid-binding protein